MIDKLDFHEEIMPNGLQWESATPHFATIVLWAFEQGLFSDELNHDEAFIKACGALEENTLSVESFVADFLDGALIKGYFSTEVGDFVADYVSTGVYYGDLEKFFGVSSIYILPRIISQLSTFNQIIDLRYSHYLQTGELPAYRTLDIKFGSTQL